MSIDEDAARAELGDDLAHLVESFDERLVGLKRITGLRAAARDRATFRLHFAGGAILKGRRLDTATDAERAFRLAGTLPDPGFTRPLAHRGTALLEPWFEGTRLDRARAGEAELAECGRLLGSVHALEVELNGAESAWLPAARLANVEYRLDKLRELALLPRRLHLRLVGLARESVPSSVSIGLVHRDLWPRNVIVDARRQVQVIDNASVQVGAHAFDWARTAYLWPMPDEHARAFRAGYLSAAPRQADESPFWMIDVLSDVALFRHQAAARGVSRPVARLRALAGTI